jgi:phage FluMu gp28-like protein
LSLSLQGAAPLLDWQRGYIEDRSRFKAVVASVQSGKSHATSLEAALDCVSVPNSLWLLLSASERQSIELMEKIKMHTRAMGAAFDEGFFERTDIVEHRAKFPNGSRIIALPANPDTARGYSAHVFLDEFALHRDGRAIWAAMMTRATRGYKVRVASTFKGTENKFYELMKSLGLHEGVRPEAQPVKANGWSGHWVDIFMAREQGMPVDIERTREALGDEEVFLQEYCNMPMSGAENFIPVEMVIACEAREASLEWDGIQDDGLFAGYDVARKKDLSVIWILQRRGDQVVTRGVIWMERMPFAKQLVYAREVAQATQRFSVDATGIGAMIAETLHGEFPWVEEVQFTAAVKERMAVELKRRMEERTILLPESAKIRRACAAVKRLVGPTGNIRFDAGRTDQGHADEFWALALANAAATGAASYVPAKECGLVGKPIMSGLREMAL